MVGAKKATGRQRGRPPIEPSQRKRNNVTVRVRDETKGQLTAAATLNGRSLSEEMEARIERSFTDEAVRYEDFGGRGSYEIFRVLGSAASAFGTAIGMADWWRNPRSFAKVRNTSSSLLKVLQKEIAESDDERLGKTLHWRMTLEVAGSTDDGGKGEYRTAYLGISRIEL